MKLAGLIPPLTTPFEDGRVSIARFAENLGHYEEAGVDGYLLLGSSGEAPLLDEDEKAALVRAGRERIPAGKPLLAGTGLESTAATIRLCKLATDCGADALLVNAPHYFRDLMDAEALAAHYRAVADASPSPVLLYDVPKFTGVQIPADVVVELAAHPNVIGIKESSGDLGRLASLLRGVPPEFIVLCGSHVILLEALDAGAGGAILAAADAFPETYAAMVRLAGKGRRGEAARLHREIAAASALAVSSYGVPGLKAAIDLRGWYGGPPRPPLLPAGRPARDKLEREIARLQRLGVLKPTTRDLESRGERA